MSDPANTPSNRPQSDRDRQADQEAERADAALQNVHEGYGGDSAGEEEIRPSDAGDGAAAEPADRSRSRPQGGAA